MKYLDQSFATPAENLACDEALLDACEGGADEILRVWQSRAPFVVVGYANEAAREVNLRACRERNVPVLRRCTGGGTVVQGPGCLSYSLCLRIDQDGPLGSITGTNRSIMETHRQLLQRLLKRPVEVQGYTDLALDGRKFSGNAQRRKRRFLLFHGSFLLSFDLALIQELLPSPSKEPAYRSNRSHIEFLRNLPLSPGAVQEGLRTVWNAGDALTTTPSAAIDRLAREKYSRDEWNLRF